VLGISEIMVSDQPFAVPGELLRDWPDATLARRQILEQYASAAGRELDPANASEDDMRRAINWLNANAEHLWPHLIRRTAVAVPKFSPSLSAKILTLDQFHCPICATQEDLGVSSTIRIRMTPESKQSLAKRKGMVKAFERALHARLAKAEKIPAARSVCLMILFVVSKARKQKDLDNMAKATVDAVKNQLFGDDRMIDHLNVLRIVSPDEEFVSLNVRATTLNSRDDTFFPKLVHDWAGAKPIELSNYF
jgi:Holliday junction resolvase RusA-like endonuclease